MSDDDYHFFSYANYTYWNMVVFVSLGEFIYLAMGFNPHHQIHDSVISKGTYCPDYVSHATSTNKPS
jgi:hypothetical protein